MNGPPTDKRPAEEVAVTLMPATNPNTEPASAPDQLGSATLDVVPYREPLPTRETPAQFPGYEILGELGRGGMGLVYKARQIDLNRVVALKVILAGAHAGGEERVRFFTEARTIARLRHPHIVQVYEVGENHGHPFFSLEFCGGGSLDRRLAGTPLPPREAAALVEKLARAMQLAHDYHIVHRDLKPANVLLVEDGSPRVTDFGLAKLLDQDGLSRSGALVGTPSYMAPEQAAGKTHEIGPPADIWALGAILYECLTGRPPFKAASVMEKIQQVQTDAPVPPSQFQKKVGRDLDKICLKCLQKEPHKRYACAVELAEDLRRFQAGETIRARPVGRVEKAASWARRRPAAAALVTVSVVAVLALLGGAAFFTNRLRQQRNEALELKDRAVRGETEAQLQKKRADDQLAVANEEKRKATEQLDRARRNLFTAQLSTAAGYLEREPDVALGLLHDYSACPLDLRDFAWGMVVLRAVTIEEASFQSIPHRRSVHQIQAKW